MFKVMMFAIFAVLTSVSAHAELKPLLKVTAEEYPGVEFTLGLNVGIHNEIDGIYYRDPTVKAPGNPITAFSFETLKKGAVIVEKSGYKIVHLIVADQKPNELLMQLTYLRYAKFGKTHNEYLRVRLNEHTSEYDVFSVNGNTERLVKSVYIATNKIFSVPVGIKYIQFAQ